MMMMTQRERLAYNVVRRYGHEAKESIKFCKLCERSKNTYKILKRYNKLMN